MRQVQRCTFLWLALASAAWAENTVGPSAQILCNKVANVAIGPTTATQIVAGIAGQSIFICGYQVSNTGTTGSFTLISGTGSTCTSPTTIITHRTYLYRPSDLQRRRSQMQVDKALLFVSPFCRWNRHHHLVLQSRKAPNVMTILATLSTI